jgi:ribonuclease HI
MNGAAPRYYLFSDCRTGGEAGRWRFVLRHADGSQRLVAEDIEPGVQGERLELLTIVRGLEALGEPSRVTLMTSCTYVREGVRHGLAEWRSNGWRWECFGQMVPVRDLDLWQRVDRAMRFHEVDCRTYRLDPPHYGGNGTPKVASAPGDSPRRGTGTMWRAIRRRIQYTLGRIASVTPDRSVGTVR